MRRAAAVLSGLALGAFLLVLPPVLLLAPPVTQSLTDRFSLTADEGLTREQTRGVAEEVRAFVAGGGGQLPAELAGRPGFDEAAAEHLADVRDVLRLARNTAWVLGLSLGLFGALAYRARRLPEIASALIVGGCTVLGAVVVAVLAGSLDFYAFFSAFHGVFFAAGTWTFPYDSLLIVLFPEPFWIAAGVLWGMASALGGTVALGAGLVMRSRLRREGA